MTYIYNAPDRPGMTPQVPTLFLAGSIENGTAEKWQNHVITELSGLDLVIYNPRRDENFTWEQTYDNPLFREQVEWELYFLKRAEIVLFYFDPNTKATVTMLELGLTLGRGKQNIFVCCPDGFHRSGNVKLTCEDCCPDYYGNSLEDTINELRCFIQEQ